MANIVTPVRNRLRIHNLPACDTISQACGSAAEPWLNRDETLDGLVRRRLSHERDLRPGMTLDAAREFEFEQHELHRRGILPRLTHQFVHRDRRRAE